MGRLRGHFCSEEEEKQVNASSEGDDKVGGEVEVGEQERLEAISMHRRKMVAERLRKHAWALG